ncbi:transposase [Streptomyces sp. F001]|uniref:transposase n=1 Tax=Streptomyces sp. F001 TaxID=1510026 RepID=UPI0019D0E36E|nr:transposase [Streptomyces sp. F001]
MGDGETERVACVTASAFRGLDMVTGEVLGAGALAERVGWLTDLVELLAAGVIAAHWSRCDLGRLASGRAPSGEKLPSNAWMALRTLGWRATVPEGVYVPDRVRRIAEEQAGRVLRSAHWRSGIVDAVLATWPVNNPDPMRRTEAEWDALRAACPDGAGLPASILRGRTRQVMRFAAARHRMPDGVCELEQAPGAGRHVVLAAADKQLSTLERCAQDPVRYAVLTVRLPMRPDPRTRADWHPVLMRFCLPPTIDASAALHAPTVRLRDGKVRLDLAHTHPAPRTKRDGHARAVAFDYGLNTLLTGGTLTLSGGLQPTVLTDAHPVFLRMNGILAKADRLRVHAEQLWAKTAHLERLIDAHHAAGTRPDPLTVAKLGVLRQEHRRISRRRERLGRATAQAAARFMVDHARTADATVIYLEDLRDMEARGKGRTLNTRLSSSVRGQIVTDTVHQAARYGIAVVIVPARGTSKHCPRCLAPFRHHAPRPQRHRAGNGPPAPSGVRLQRGQSRGMAAHRRPRPPAPTSDRPEPDRRQLHAAPDGSGAGPTGPAHPPPGSLSVRRADSCCGPDEERADEKPPRPQQATRGPPPPRTPGHRASGHGAGWPASGGAAAPVSPAPQPAASGAAGTAHDEQPHTAPATRGPTRRRIPPARPRHPHHPKRGHGTTQAAETTFLGGRKPSLIQENLSSSETLSYALATNE